MKNKIFYSIIISLLLFCFSASAFTVYEYDFGAFYDYTTLGFDYSTTACSGIQYPVTSPFGSYAWGLNQSISCVSTNTQTITAPFSRISSETATIYFDVAVNYVNKTGAVAYLEFSLYNRTSSGGTKVLGITATNVTLTTSSNLAGFTACAITVPNYYNYSAIMSIDYTNKQYDVYINNTLVCDDKTLTTGDATGIAKISLSASQLATQNVNAYIDNIEITSTGVNVSQLPVNSPCDSDSDCITDNCVFGVCQYKSSLQACSNNYECLSGQCINGVCSKASMFQALDDSRKNLFGNDKETSNLICMIFIAISIAGLIIIGGIAGSIKAGMYLAIFAAYLESFFFALIGWLSFFIIFAEVLVAVIFIIATIFIMNKQ